MCTLFIILLILKLTGLVNISWGWVTAPLWLPIAVGIFYYLFIVLVLGLTCVIITFI